MIAQREIAPGVAVSAIGFGGYHLGMVKDESEAIRLLHAAIDAGITFLDNAWEYNEHVSEERMGKGLADGNRRDARVPDDEGLHARARRRRRDAAARRVAAAVAHRSPRPVAGPRVRLRRRSGAPLRQRRRRRSARARQARREGALRRLHRPQASGDPPRDDRARLPVRHRADAAQRDGRQLPQLREERAAARARARHQGARDEGVRRRPSARGRQGRSRRRAALRDVAARAS